MGIEPHLEIGKLAAEIRRRVKWRHLANLTNLLIGKQTENKTT